MVTVETDTGQSGKSNDRYTSVITVETCTGQ